MLHAMAVFVDVNIYEHLYTISSFGVICPRTELRIISYSSLLGVGIKLEPAAILNS